MVGLCIKTWRPIPAPIPAFPRKRGKVRADFMR